MGFFTLSLSLSLSPALSVHPFLYLSLHTTMQLTTLALPFIPSPFSPSPLPFSLYPLLRSLPLLCVSICFECLIRRNGYTTVAGLQRQQFDGRSFQLVFHQIQCVLVRTPKCEKRDEKLTGHVSQPLSHRSSNHGRLSHGCT